MNYARGGSEVGRSLRQARMSRDLSIAQVAAQLRIRAGHIHDIEAGHFADLPGVAYAVGFVRAYADFVDLDGEALAKAFRDEFAAVAAEPELRMPLAQTERSIPGGAVLFASLLCAVGAYAAWYLTTSEFSAPNSVAGAEKAPAVVAAAKPGPQTQPGSAARSDITQAAQAPTDNTAESRADKAAGNQIAAAEAETATGEAGTDDGTIEGFTLPDLEPAGDAPVDVAQTAAAPAVPEPAGSAPAEPAPQVALRAPPEGFAPIPDAPIPEPVVLDTAPLEQQPGVQVSAVAEQAPAEETPAATAGAAEPMEQEAPEQAVETVVEPASDSAAGEQPQAAPEALANPVIARSEAPAESAPTTTADPSSSGTGDQPSGESAQTVQTSSEPVTAVAALEPQQEAAQPAAAAEEAAPAQPPASESWQSRMTSPMEAQAGAIGGPATGAARIVIEATEDCWVQVSDGADGLLLSRVLRAGESFTVPNTAGLVMDTGNAGALVLRIDGMEVTDLGKMGEVMRGLPLDPERLASAAQQ